MKLLIIDDDPTTIESLLCKINWDKLGLDTPLKAYNVSSAKKIVQENPIDILLCDVEMPGETGFVLLEWCQENNYQVECIFLTNHLEFNYVRQAIKLHAFDYVSKTVSTEELEGILRKIIQKAISRKERGTDYVKHSSTRFLLDDVLYGKIPTDRAFVENLIDTHDFYLKKEQKCIPLYLVFSRFADKFRNMDTSEIKFITDNILEELYSSMGQTYTFCNIEDHFLYYSVVIILDEQSMSETILEQLEDISQTALSFFTQISNLPPTIYLYKKLYDIWALNEWQKQAVKLEKENTISRNQIVDTDRFHDFIAADHPIKVPEDTKELLMSNRPDVLLSKIKMNLTQNHFGTTISKEALSDFYWDLVHTFSSVLSLYDVNVSTILNLEPIKEQSFYATYSTIDLIKWSSAVIPEVCRAINEKTNESNPVELMKQFIHSEYASKIGRNEIADSVHMSPDYAGRLFKNTTGKTILEYLISYRIEKAKELMLTTSYSISEISIMVGYEHFSHFSNSFHSLENMSPREYRKMISSPDNE